MEFVLTKNIDPMMKIRFVRSLDSVLARLKEISSLLKNIKDGTISKDKERSFVMESLNSSCSEVIKDLKKKLKNQKKREKSVLYDQII